MSKQAFIICILLSIFAQSSVIKCNHDNYDLSQALEQSEPQAQSYNDNDDDSVEFEQNCYHNSNEIYCHKIPSKCINICNYNINFLINSTKLLTPSIFQYFRFNQNVTIKFYNIVELGEDLFNGLILNTRIAIKIQFIGNNQNNLVVNSYVFRSLLLLKKSNLKFEFLNYNKIEFKQNSLTNVKQLDESAVEFYFENVNYLVFKKNCSNNWQQFFNDATGSDIIVYNLDNHLELINEFNLHDADEDIDGRQMDYTVFRINATNIRSVRFESNSFSNLILNKNNLLQIIIDSFSQLTVDEFAFTNITQNFESIFELNFLGDYADFNSNLFTNLIQFIKCKFILLIDIAKSNICLKENFLSNIIQNNNSTILIQLLSNVNESSVSLGSNTFTNIKQFNNSYIQLYVFNSKMCVLNGDFLVNLVQLNQCMLDVWFSNVANVRVKTSGFNQIKQFNESIIRVTSTSDVSNGVFVEEIKPFMNVYQDDAASDIVYDFTVNVKFQLKSLTILQNSVKKVSLHEYELNEQDFCGIHGLIDTSTNTLVRLPPNTKCSCIVYYLYRNARLLNSSDWISYTPNCYQEHFTKHRQNSLNDIEAKCEFDWRVKDCATNSQTPQNIDIQCSSSFKQYEDDLFKSISTSSIQQPHSPFISILLIIIIIIIFFLIIFFILFLLKLNKFIYNYGHNNDDFSTEIEGQYDNALLSSGNRTKQYTVLRVKKSNSTGSSSGGSDDVRTSLLSPAIYDNMI